MTIMANIKLYKKFHISKLHNLMIVACLCVVHGCDSPDNPVDSFTPVPTAETVTTPATDLQTAEIDTGNPVLTQQNQFNIGNKSYLFDVSDHTIEEMQALLNRAKEISLVDSDSYKDLDIVMVLHGPDIDWFTEQNREKNFKLIDLARELDKLDIIDMKVCETAMDKRGIKREDVPEFIESVPYAPDEMKKLLQEGFINL